VFGVSSTFGALSKSKAPESASEQDVATAADVSTSKPSLLGKVFGSGLLSGSGSAFASVVKDSGTPMSGASFSDMLEKEAEQSEAQASASGREGAGLKDQVETFTGEESERVVCVVRGVLQRLEPGGEWARRGEGELHLNVKQTLAGEIEYARIGKPLSGVDSFSTPFNMFSFPIEVMRTERTFVVILNLKLFSGMSFEYIPQRRVRFALFEDSKIINFVFVVSPLFYSL
jgi:hypothetical protein